MRIDYRMEVRCTPWQLWPFLDEAEKQGLSPSIAEPVWRTLIEQCIRHELIVWDQLREEAPKRAEG